MTELLDFVFTEAFWIAVLRIATPLILGTLGALVCERAGVLNLGIEGIMVAGAFGGWLAGFLGASLWLGVAAAAAVGRAFGLVRGVVRVHLALLQRVAGRGITLLAASMPYYACLVAIPLADSVPTS